MGMVNVALLDFGRHGLELGNRVVDIANALVIGLPDVVSGVIIFWYQQVGSMKIMVLKTATSQHLVTGDTGHHIQKGKRVICSSIKSLVCTRFLSFQQHIRITPTVVEADRLHITHGEPCKRIVIKIDKYFRVVRELKTLHVTKEIIMPPVISSDDTQGVLLLRNLCTGTQCDNGKQCY